MKPRNPVLQSTRAHLDPLKARTLATLLAFLPCTLANADISGPFGGPGSVDGLEGSHTVQEGAEDPGGLGAHTVQEGVQPTSPFDLGSTDDWDIGFDVPVGIDPTSLSPEQYLGLRLGLVEFTAPGEFQLIDDWVSSAFFNYGDQYQLFDMFEKLGNFQLTSGNLTDVTSIMTNPREFMQTLMDSGLTYAPPVDPNLPWTTGEVPAPGSLVLLLLGGLAAGARGRRRRPA